MGLELLLFESIVDFRHVKGVSHCEGVCIENRILQKESKMRKESKRMREGEIKKEAVITSSRRGRRNLRMRAKGTVERSRVSRGWEIIEWKIGRR